MPKVTFVNEHRIVEAAAGERVRDVAREAGVALDVSRFRGGFSCGGHGVCRACLCWVEESAPGAAGPRTWMEKLRGLRGWRRLGCRAKVIADLKVYSIPAAANRVGAPREIGAVPSPVIDPSAPRKPNDAASTAAHVHGHPSAVGRGRVEERGAAAAPASPEPNEIGARARGATGPPS